MSDGIPQWAKDLKREEKYNLTDRIKVTLPDPPGFKPIDEGIEGTSTTVRDFDSENRIRTVSIQRAWQIASEPVKSVPMNFLMSYMSGNSLQIIPIVTAFMFISGPISSIIDVKSKFQHLLKKDEEMPPQIVGAMAMYIFSQLLLIAVHVYKLNSMGLFPTTSSDWLAWQKPMEYVYHTVNI